MTTIVRVRVQNTKSTTSTIVKLWIHSTFALSQWKSMETKFLKLLLFLLFSYFCPHIMSYYYFTGLLVGAMGKR